MHYWDVWGHSLHTLEAAEGVTGGAPEFSGVLLRAVDAGERGLLRRDCERRAYAAHRAEAGGAVSRYRQAADQDAGNPTAAPAFSAIRRREPSWPKERLRSLRLSSRGVSMVSRMVEHHLRPDRYVQRVGRKPGRMAHQPRHPPLLPGRGRRGFGYALPLPGRLFGRKRPGTVLTRNG